MLRVLVVEDDPAARERFADAIDRAPDLALMGAVGSLGEARAALAAAAPDILLTDLGLPDGTGVELISDLSAKGVLCMVVTVFGDEKNVLRAISAGAQSYLLKDGSAQDVADAIAQLVEGGSPISPSIARHILRRFRTPEAKREPAVRLTERESEVLGFIAKGFTYAEIAGLVGLSTHTVTSHVRKIYKKLAVSSRGEAVYEAVQLGILELD